MCQLVHELNFFKCFFIWLSKFEKFEDLLITVLVKLKKLLENEDQSQAFDKMDKRCIGFWPLAVKFNQNVTISSIR